MVELIPGQFPKDRLRLRATRQIKGKRWEFDTVIPRDQWEDLLYGTKMSAEEAYKHARDFWDHLADKKADELIGGADPASPTRQIEYFWPDLASLELAYNDFLRTC